MEIHTRRFRVLVPFFGLVIVAGGFPASIFPQAADVPAKLTYSRTFKGSTPEYLLITVDSKGLGTFEGHKLDEAQSPRPLQLSAGTTERIFALAGQLHNFQSVDLESHKKVANLGQKSLTYQQGEGVKQVVFNYTENQMARELVDILEAVGAVEEHISDLEFGMKYDPLGLPQELLQIQIELNKKSLADPEMLLPTLEKITHGSRFLHLAQVRAQQIIERIQPNP
jgi:hypothetical protein